MTIENQEVKVGDEVRVGMQLMTVDEITEFDTVIVIDQDGEELELTENEIDVYVDRSKVIIGSQGTMVLTYLESLER
jgi:hypothetical protein